MLTIGLSIFFVGGGNLKQLAILLAIGIPSLAVTMVLSDYPLERLQEWYAVHFNPAAISPDTLRILALLKTGGASARIRSSGSRKPVYRCCGPTICSPISARIWGCPACCW